MQSRTHMKAEEVAVFLGCSIGTVYNYRKHKVLTQEQVGLKWYFVRSQVEELKQKLAAAGQATMQEVA